MLSLRDIADAFDFHDAAVRRRNDDFWDLPGSVACGFRKKNATNAESSSRKIPARGSPNAIAPRARIRRGIRKTNASLTIIECDSKGRNGERSASFEYANLPICSRIIRSHNSQSAIALCVLMTQFVPKLRIMEFIWSLSWSFFFLSMTSST